jgi:DNA-binding IclR family transcriptional regulator
LCENVIMSEPADNPAGLEILSKANAVVTALEARADLTAAEIADAVGEPVSSTYRLLQTLTAIGWVDPGRRRGLFRLGIYFLRVGGHLEERLDVREASRVPLKELRRETGWSSFLFIQRRTRGVCVERFEGSVVRSLAIQVGESLPLHHGAGPRAILAFLPAGEQNSVIEQFASDYYDPQWPAPDQEALRANITADRSRGYAISDEDVTPGIAALGAPVFSHRGEVQGAVSVSGLRDPVLDPALGVADLVQRTAREVSRALGYSGGDGLGYPEGGSDAGR